jgi:hypothetical protein
MTIEQKSELNRFVDQSIPLTWGYRWRQLKMLLPILVFTCVYLLEMGIGRAWLTNKLSFDFILTLFGGCLVLFLFIFGMLEIQNRTGQRSKRVMQIEDKRIIVRPAKNQFIRWKRISKFQLEPIPEAPGLMKLKVFGLASKKHGRAIWSMVLENPAQVQELIGFLQKRAVEIPTNYQIELLERPAPMEHPVRFSFLGSSIYLSGMFLLLHGVPMLFATMGRSPHDSDRNSKPSPEQIAKLHQFILNHFSSKEEFRHFFLTLGSGLTMAGCILLFWGWWLMNRKPVSEPNAPTLTAA